MAASMAEMLVEKMVAPMVELTAVEMVEKTVS